MLVENIRASITSFTADLNAVVSNPTCPPSLLTQHQGTMSCMWEIAITRRSKWGMFAAWLPLILRLLLLIVTASLTQTPSADLDTTQEWSLSPRLFASFQRGNKCITAVCEASVI